MKAVSLHYDGVKAPTVSAQAEGPVAQEMLRLATELGIPIHQDAALTETLSQLRLNAEVPLALFVTIAEIIAFAYQLRDTAPPGWHTDGERL